MRPPYREEDGELAETIRPMVGAPLPATLVDDVMIAADQKKRGAWPRARTVIFWLHLASGIVAGVVVFIMSLTGFLLTYERQLSEWAGTRYALAPARGAAEAFPASLDSLVARVTSSHDNASVQSVTVRRDRMSPVMIALESRRSLAVDPITGQVLGDDADVRAFNTWLTRWHRSLALGPTSRDPVGVSITGACNLAFLFMILTGMVLWWPRQWSARAFRAVAWFSRRAKGRARDWNWHHVFGLWCAVPLLVVVSSATFMSYRWPQALVESMTGSAPAAERGGERGGTRGATGGGAQSGGAPATSLTALVSDVNLDSALTLGRQRFPSWTSITLRAPRGQEKGLSLTIATASSNRPSDRQQLGVRDLLLPDLGASTRRPPTRAAAFRAWIRPLHTGEAFGTVGQTIAGIASLGGVLLAFTGFALSWRRLIRSQERRRMAAARLG